MLRTSGKGEDKGVFIVRN